MFVERQPSQLSQMPDKADFKANPGNILTLENAMTRDDTISYLTKELTTMFPSNGVNVRERDILGKNIYILYTHFKDKSQCSMGILENDPAYMYFCITNEHTVEFPSTHCGRVFDNPLVKFRKIRGKTEQEAAEKLVVWFKKNQEHIKNV